MDKIDYWLLSMFICNPAIGSGLDLKDSIKVKDLYIETEKRIGTNRDYYLRDEEAAKYDLNLGLNLELPATLYYNNKVTSTTDDNQFRHIGYEFEFGARPFKGIDLYIQHFSGHALDESYDKNFPQRNKFGIRFNLIRD